MLVIRMQRTGRKGHAQFRVVVQDSRLHPSSGRVVASLGSYNPHSKEAILEKEKAATYLSNGAQPSDRVVKLFEKEGIKLPEWVNKSSAKKRPIRNPEKLRRNRPAESEKTEDPVAESTEPAAKEPTSSETETAPESKAPVEESISIEAETPSEPTAEAAAPAEEPEA
jgi:small subunit ribosomal protein S16